MALTDAIFVILATTVVATSAAPTPENLCICQSDISSPEVQELWKFFKDHEPETEHHPVTAGQLSPNVPCGNCFEYSRRKRRIFPGMETEKPDTVTEIEGDIPVAVESAENDEGRLDFDRSCPEGMVRVSSWCVPEDYE